MDTLYSFWENITHYKTKSIHFLGLMNSATRKGSIMVPLKGSIRVPLKGSSIKGSFTGIHKRSFKGIYKGSIKEFRVYRV